MMRQLVYTFSLFLFFTGASGFALKGGITRYKADIAQGYDAFARMVYPSFLLSDTAKIIPVAYPAGGENNSDYAISANTREAIDQFTHTFLEEYIGLKSKGVSQFRLIESIFKKYGLPVELKYLAVIESKLSSGATSWAGAVGPWQLMPKTAKLLGLKVTHEVDERKDLVKSTKAAARYIKELHSEFDDWLLVMAAYNCGPGRVKWAMRKSGSDDFWKMQQFLPLETRKHVKKYIGIFYTFEGKLGVTALSKEEVAAHLKNTSPKPVQPLTQDEIRQARTLWVSGKYHSRAIAKSLEMEMDEFNRYNPDFDKQLGTSDNRYELRLPAQKMDLFIRNKYEILQLSLEFLLNANSITATGS